MRKLMVFRNWVVAFVGLIIFIWSATSSANEKITWSFDTMSFSSAMTDYFMKQIPAGIAKTTNGRLTIQMNKNLVPEMEKPHAMSDRRIDGGMVTTVFFSGEWPYPNVTALPFLIANDEELKQVTYKILWEVLEKSYREKYNLVFLGAGIYPTQVIWSNKPLKTIEDFKNFKIRGHNYEAAMSLKLMGASPVTMPWPEVYMALQRGVMDGIVTTAVGIYKSGLHKITKYANMWPLAPAQPWAWVVNGESWSQLPKDLKPKVKQVFREITDETFKIGMEEGQKCLKEGASEGNVNIIYPKASEIQKGRVITKPVYQRWLDRCKKAGDPGDELLKKVRALLSEIRSK